MVPGLRKTFKQLVTVRITLCLALSKIIAHFWNLCE